MIEREILKDCNNYKPKLIGPFTARQVVCLAIGSIIAIPLFLILNKYIFTLPSLVISLCFAVPAFLCGWWAPYNVPLEKFVFSLIKTSILAPTIRKYKINNPYDYKEPELTKKELKAMEKLRKKELKKFKAYS